MKPLMGSGRAGKEGEAAGFFGGGRRAEAAEWEEVQSGAGGMISYKHLSTHHFSFWKGNTEKKKTKLAEEGLA